MLRIRHDHYFHHDDNGQSNEIREDLKTIKEQLINQNIKLNNMGQALDQVKQDLADLKQAIADEKAEVGGKFDELSAKIDTLLAQVANGASADDLATLSTEIKSDAADIKAIFTAPTPTPEG